MRRKIYGRVMAAVLAAALLAAGCSSGTQETQESGTAAQQETGQQESAGSKEFSYFGAIWSPVSGNQPDF